MTAHNEASEATTKTETELLRDRATQMGLSFHPSIGDTALKKKIKDHLESDDTSSTEETPVKEESTTSKKLSRGQIMAQHRRSANALVRVVVIPNNPVKNLVPGELISVSNRVIGTICCMVPFNNEEGWHLPQAIVNVLKERKYQAHVKKKINGQMVSVPKLLREFNVQELEPLTKEEMEALATTQRETGSLRED